eukprot:4480791-Pleurochrysis_carterae.AAC.1
MLLVGDLSSDPATVQHVSGVSPLFLAFTPEAVARVLSNSRRPAYSITFAPPETIVPPSNAPGW